MMEGGRKGPAEGWRSVEVDRKEGKREEMKDVCVCTLTLVNQRGEGIRKWSISEHLHILLLLRPHPPLLLTWRMRWALHNLRLPRWLFQISAPPLYCCLFREMMGGGGDRKLCS